MNEIRLKVTKIVFERKVSNINASKINVEIEF